MPGRNSYPIHFFGPPVKVSYDKDGIPTFTALLLEDFETAFSARVHDGERYVDVTGAVEWEVVEGKGKHIRENKKEKHKFTGLKKGKGKLRATYQGAFTDILIDVMESDLLIYAPDGYVYRVPGQVWLKGKAESLEKPGTEEKVEALPWGDEDLPEPIWKMLDNEVTLANIPNEVKNWPEANEEPVTAENVTCFLLNLNSIMLSYSPPKAEARKDPRQAKAQRATWQMDPPPPAQPPARKKRR